MRTLLSLVATLSLVGMVGCVGGIDNTTQGDDDDQPPPPPPPPPAGTAQKKFEDGVYPTIAAKCIGCHKENAVAGGAPASSGFVKPTLSGAYDLIIGFPNVHGGFAANAKILTYVTLQGHQGQTYDPDQIAAIEDWLSTELQERGGGGGTTPPPGGIGVTTEKLLNDFSACMTIDNFTAANMPDGCGNLNTNNNANCNNCHETGGFRFAAGRQATNFFDRVSSNRTYLQKYFQVTGVENPATAKLEPNLPLFEAVLSGTGTYFQHERVNNTPTNNSCTQAMQAFYTATMEKIAAGVTACGPSKLID